MRTGFANRVDKVVLGTSAFFTTNRQKNVLVEMNSLRKQGDCEGDEYCCPMQKRLTWRCSRKGLIPFSQVTYISGHLRILFISMYKQAILAQEGALCSLKGRIERGRVGLLLWLGISSKFYSAIG